MLALFITIEFAETPPSTQRLVAGVARRLRGVAGLKATTWTRSGTDYALWQVFEDRACAEQYLRGPTLDDLAALPGCDDIYIQELEIAEGLNLFSSPAAAGIEHKGQAPVLAH